MVTGKRHRAGASNTRGPRNLLSQTAGLGAPYAAPRRPLAKQSSSARRPHRGDVSVLYAGVHLLGRRSALAEPVPSQKPRPSGCRHWCSSHGRSAGGGLSSAERPAVGATPGPARAGAETIPNLVEVVPLPPCERVSRRSWLMDPTGGLGWSVQRLVTGTLFRRFPPTRVAGSRASFPGFVGF